MADEYLIIFISKSMKGLIQSDIKIEISTKYNRRISNAEHLEKSINTIWNKRIQENRSLYNGTKFRWGGHKCNEKESLLQLHLAITDYKTFLGTNESIHAEEWMKLGKIEHGDSQAYIANSLGVGAVVETSDKCIILIRRSMTVGESRGKIGLPAGHPEPKNVVGPCSKEEMDVNKIDSTAVTNELFNSTLLEIRDEINLPLDKLGNPALVGITGNLKSANKPSLVFYVRCSLTSQEVIELYRKGSQLEAFESTDVFSVPVDTIQNIQSTEMYTQLTPAAKGALDIYNKLRLISCTS